MDKLTPPAPAPEIVPAEPVEQISEEKAVSLLSDLPASEQQDLEAKASTWLDTVTSMNPHSQEFKAQVTAIGNVARRTFESTGGTSSRFMSQSLRSAKGSGSESQAKVAQDLVNLRTTMDDLAPTEDTFAQRALSIIPGMNAVKRYFRGYESNQKQLSHVLTSLAHGQEMLLRDNAELAVERRTLWEDLHNLQKAAHLLSLLDDQVVRRGSEARAAGKTEVADGLEKDVLFAVRQRRQDITTQIAVTVQAYMAMGLIEDNNTKLMQGVERARTTTVTALRTAVMTAQALENQKIVLDQIDAINATTNDLINRTSDMLASNTVRIQEQASNPGVATETLQRAFDSLFTTMDGIDAFRTKANENFLITVSELEKQVERAQPYMRRMQGTADEQIGQISSASDLLEIED